MTEKRVGVSVGINTQMRDILVLLGNGADEGDARPQKAADILMAAVAAARARGVPEQAIEDITRSANLVVNETVASFEQLMAQIAAANNQIH